MCHNMYRFLKQSIQIENNWFPLTLILELINLFYQTLSERNDLVDCYLLRMLELLLFYQTCLLAYFSQLEP